MSDPNWANFVAVRNCTNKRRFDSEAECLDSIAKQRAPVELRAYKCSLCAGWHKTKQFPKGK